MSSLLIPVQMRFGDIDSYGHVNNVVLLQYLEEARVRLMNGPLPDPASAGVPAGTTFRDLAGDRRTVVGRQEVEYVHELLYRTDPVFVRVWISSVGGSSFVLDYTVQEEDGSRTYAVAQSVTVQLDPVSGRPTALDEPQRSALAHWSGDPTRFSRRPVVAGAQTR